MDTENEKGLSLADRIAARRADIQNHERVLVKYQGSRWYDQSRRNLEEKRQELAALEAQQISEV